MKSFGAISAILAVFLSSADAAVKKTVMWPENGSIKFSTPTSPAKISVDLVDCTKVDVNFADNVVQVHAPGGETHTLDASERLRADGGELVVLFSQFGGQGHVIVNAEDLAGGFETRMLSFALPQCKISRVRATGIEGSPVPTDGHVAISEEIVKAFQDAYGKSS
ncbi:hypothetical protein, conserved [Eimeria brunetti]|uniref:Uncharacterized protein n=1 Tax=Eimeria brunetti TaxID=51314 RepID=U6LJ48_9EIME|nr:hypothetical protein, conserved [Eimeria brunetti]